MRGGERSCEGRGGHMMGGERSHEGGESSHCGKIKVAWVLAERIYEPLRTYIL